MSRVRLPGSWMEVVMELRSVMVAFNPTAQTRLVMEGTSGSSQNCWQHGKLLIHPEGRVCYLFMDSWAVAQGLAN